MCRFAISGVLPRRVVLSGRRVSGRLRAGRGTASHCAPSQAHDLRLGRANVRRVQRNVLGITLRSYAGLEIVLRGFAAVSNKFRQRELDWFPPEMVLRKRLKADSAAVNPNHRPPNCGVVKRVLRVVADGKGGLTTVQVLYAPVLSFMPPRSVSRRRR